MKLMAFVPLLALVVAISGCTSSTVTGSFELLLSDQPVEIDSFDSLKVQITTATLFPKGGQPLTIDVNSEVDLTQVVGDNAVPLFKKEIPAGTYEKLSLEISSAEGIVSGEVVDVAIPSNSLMVTKEFTIGGDPISFVYDISVVKAGQSGRYNLLPVISETGIIGKDIPEGKIQRGEIGAEKKKIHANAIVERARVKIKEGNVLLDKENYAEAKKAFDASQKGFEIAETRYQAAIQLSTDSEAETGLQIAKQSQVAVGKLGESVAAYQAGNNATAAALGKEALDLFEKIPQAKGVSK